VTPAKLSQPLTLGANLAATGTSINFTSIPNWVKRITLMFAQVSTNGSSMYQIRLGTSGGIVATGYDSIGTFSGYSQAGYTSTTGFLIPSGSSANFTTGHLVVTNLTGNAWVASISAGIKDVSNAWSWAGGGFITLGGVLDRVTVTTVNGTDSFDGGSISIMYEG
jgi:hypothetical protein